jgi:hypothetical protein
MDRIDIKMLRESELSYRYSRQNVTTRANQSTAYDAVPKINAMNSFSAMNQ